MWSRTYCCCAVPLYNSGIYLILLQFLIISLVSGILTFAAPSIVAVALPSWCHIIFGCACLAVSAVQVLGFFGVYRERPKLFKNYARLNILAVLVALILAAAFIGLSASHHSTAVTKCEAAFSAQVSNSTATAQVSTGSGICNVWTWVQVGIMGLLWGILVLCESYFLMYQSIYSSEQKLDHARYESVVNEAAEEIRQSGLWDHARPSADFANQGHGRNLSKSSGLRNEIRPASGDYGGGYADTDGGYSTQPRQGSTYDPYANVGPSGYGGQQQEYQQHQGEVYYPDQAHEAYAGPTPTAHYGYENHGEKEQYDGVGYPNQARTEHPLEGSKGRKTPKIPSPSEVSGMSWDAQNQYR